MKKNIERLQRVGRITDYICMFLILVYLIITIYFYIDNKVNMHSIALDKPFLIYSLKWIYAIIIILCLLIIKKNANLYWLLINCILLNILLLCLIIWYLSIIFYVSIFDMFLLEIISIFLIFRVNSKLFITEYNIDVNYKRVLIIIIASVFIAIISYLILYYNQIGKIIL